jgi:hypothetical protein
VQVDGLAEKFRIFMDTLAIEQDSMRKVGNSALKPCILLSWRASWSPVMGLSPGCPDLYGRCDRVLGCA